MRKRATSIAVAGLMAVLLILGLSAGCLDGLGYDVTGSGDLTTETFNFSDFSRVEAHSGFQIELTQSNTFSIEITADDNIHEFIEVEKSGETLSIRLRGNRFYHSVTLRAKVTMPELYKIELSGGSQGSITGFSSSHDFEVEMSGGSRLSGDITASDTVLELSGGSQANLEGEGDDLTVDTSGGSQLDLEDFLIDNANIKISGGGRATVNVSGTLDVDLSGGSRVLYVGDPTLGSVKLSGDSRVSEK